MNLAGMAARHLTGCPFENFHNYVTTSIMNWFVIRAFSARLSLFGTRSSVMLIVTGNY